MTGQGRSDSASGSSAAGSMRGSTCRPSAPCATPTCSASSAPTRKTPHRPPSMRARSTSAARRHMARSPTWSRIRRSTRSGSPGRITRASRTSKRSCTRSKPDKERLSGIACEKPLARNVAEAKRVAELVKRTGIAHGYLENQVFAPQVETGRELLWARGAATTGRPYLARAAEEHSGPHMPWFWRGELQGGGVLNDMMCHSALVVRHLLTKPGAPARDGAAKAGHRAHREPQVDAARLREAAREDLRQGRRLRESSGRGFREHDDRVRDGRRTHGDRRGLDVVELCRSRPTAVGRACWAPSTRCRGTRSTAGSSYSSPAPCGARPARISSRSRTPRWG